MQPNNGVPSPKHLLKCIALTFTVVFAVAQTSGPASIAVNDPRPLAQASLQLEKQVGLPVNYEDIPLLYDGDIVDVAAKIMSPEQQAAHPGAHVLVPKGGPLSVALPITPTTSISSSTLPLLLNALVAGYSAAGLPGTYSAYEESGSFFITPASVRNAGGAPGPAKRILDTKINLPFQERTAGETLEMILRQTSAGNLPVKIGTVPVGAMIRSRVQVAAADETARTALIRLLAALGTVKSSDGVILPAFSYHLNFDPGQNYYVLNIHVLPQLVRSLSVTSSDTGPAPGVHSTLAVPSGSNPYAKR